MTNNLVAVEVMVLNLFKQEKGFTLIEVLVALSILMIMIFTFTLLYTSSFEGIFRAGRVSEELFNAQRDMDNIIAEGSAADTTEVVISFDLHTVDVKGEVKDAPYEYERRSGSLQYFMPEGQ